MKTEEQIKAEKREKELQVARNLLDFLGVEKALDQCQQFTFVRIQEKKAGAFRAACTTLGIDFSEVLKYDQVKTYKIWKPQKQAQ